MNAGCAKDPDTIREMFSRIARRYDLNNRLHSLWRDQAWRKAAARAARVRPGDSVLDAACGTGDLAGILARGPAERVIGVDFCPAMLDVARRRFEKLLVRWVLADVARLPFQPRDFDAVTIAFGLRNLPDPQPALKEFHRVLRPGGRLVVLEFCGGRPRGLVRRLVNLHVNHVMPHTAAFLARDKTGAYNYLRRSIAEFVPPEELTRWMRTAEFGDIHVRRLAFGLAALLVGIKQ